MSGMCVAWEKNSIDSTMIINRGKAARLFLQLANEFFQTVRRTVNWPANSLNGKFSSEIVLPESHERSKIRLAATRETVCPWNYNRKPEDQLWECIRNAFTEMNISIFWRGRLHYGISLTSTSLDALYYIQFIYYLLITMISNNDIAIARLILQVALASMLYNGQKRAGFRFEWHADR